jgi:hypothetical protein
MKNLFFLIFISMIFWGCKDPATEVIPNGPFPDLVVDLTIERNGTVLETIEFTSIEHQSNTNRGTGDYNRTTTQFNLEVTNALVGGPKLEIAALPASFAVQEINLAATNGASLYFDADGQLYSGTTGIVEITSIGFHSDLGVDNSEQYFVDFAVDLTLDGGNAGTITITGTIKGARMIVVEG